MNPFAGAPACDVCGDHRVLAKHPSARKEDLVKCQNCGLMAPEEYDRWRKDQWIKAQAAPSICELDLTPEEFKAFEGFRETHPHTSKLTILTWIEGQRYDPAKDEEFLKEARAAFRKWRHGDAS